MKAFGLILKILVGLIAIIVISVGVILATVDPNDYKAEITQAVKDSTGRDFSVSNMSLSLFPKVSVDMEQATLSNAPGFSDKPFIAIEKIQVGAAILPLLSKNLEVETLTLHGLDLNLEKNTDGQTNWDDLVKPKATSNNQDKNSTENTTNPLDVLSSLNFGGIDIQNGKVQWQDQENQQNIELTNLNLATTAITFGQYFDVNVLADATLSQPVVNSRLDLTLQAKIDKNGHYDVKNVVLENITSGKALPVEKATTKIELATFKIANETLSIPTIKINYDIIGGQDSALNAINGELNVNNVTGNLQQQKFKVEQFAQNSQIDSQLLKSGKAELTINSALDLDLTQQTAALNNLAIRVFDINLQAQVAAKQIIDNPLVNAQFNISDTNLKAALLQLKTPLPNMANANALSQFSAYSELSYAQQNQTVQLKKLKVQLDESTLTGNAKIANFSKPLIRYNLNLDNINISHYLPANTPAHKPPEPNNKDQHQKIELPTELMRKLDIEGTIKVKQFQYDNLKPKNILLTTKASKGNIQLKPLRADIFNTRVNAQAGINVADSVPKYNFKTQTQNLPIGEVMKAFTGDDKISGTGLLDANLNTSGDRLSEFKQGLNGSVTANLVNGAIKGFNLAQAIRLAKAKLSGKKVENTNSEEKTDFTELNVQAKIKNGIITTQKLNAKAPYMRLVGKGDINLPKESLDYLVTAKITSSDKGQGGADLKELKGLSIPIKLKGNYLDPSISLDLESLIEEKAKAEIEKKINDKKEKVIEDVKKKAEDRLKDLLPKGFGF